jgi:hypothetical protein
MSSLASPTAARSSRRFDPAGFSPEFELLLACCAVGDRESASRGVRACLDATVDWEQVLRLGQHHSVLPLVYQAVRDLSGGIPSAILDDLRGRYEHNARRNLAFTGELFRILDCLAAHDVPAIPYKGPVLAESVYRDLALREFSDLDILVRPGDVLRAKAALQGLGYAPNVQLSDATERAYLASGYEYTLDGPAGRNLLEIQWGIVPRFYAVDFDCSAFFERAGTTTAGGRLVRTLSPEDLLVTLCVHAAKHAWIRLCWLRDLAGVLESQNIDWHIVEPRGRDLGIQRIVAVSLLLAQRLLDATVPDSLRDRWQRDPEIENLCNKIARHMPGAEEYSTESLEYFRLMLRLRERVSDQFRFALRLIFTPGMGEWELLRLPASLFPLYRVIRLFRLGGKLLTRRVPN